jgi:hypothetical protein
MTNCGKCRNCLNRAQGNRWRKRCVRRECVNSKPKPDTPPASKKPPAGKKTKGKKTKGKKTRGRKTAKAKASGQPRSSSTSSSRTVDQQADAKSPQPGPSSASKPPLPENSPDKIHVPLEDLPAPQSATVRDLVINDADLSAALDTSVPQINLVSSDENGDSETGESYQDEDETDESSSEELSENRDVVLFSFNHSQTSLYSFK